MPTTTERHLRMYHRLGGAALFGAGVGAVVPLPNGQDIVTRALVGFCVAAAVFAVPLLVVFMRADTAATQAYVAGLPSERRPTDLIAVSAAFAGLAGIMQMLLTGDSTAKGFEAALALATVGTAWVLIHTMYVVRYARHYYNAEPGSVDFNTNEAPRFSDFAYLAYTLGMTYQVSDTDIKTPELRKIIVFHTLLSYVFGTGVIAATINLVAGAAK